MESTRRHSRLDRKILNIATALFFTFLSVSPVHAIIVCDGFVSPNINSYLNADVYVSLLVGSGQGGWVYIGEPSTLTTYSDAYIGYVDFGSIEVLGLWRSGSYIGIGMWGNGELIVGPDGAVQGRIVTLGVLSESSGDATILGTLIVSERFCVGSAGTGNLTIEEGGSVWSGVSPSLGEIDRIAFNEGSVGSVTVTGTGSSWENYKGLIIGDQGTASLTIEYGGSVSSWGTTSNDPAYIGLNEGSEGTVTVTGTGSTWDCMPQRPINIGTRGVGSLTIADGAVVNSDGGNIGSDGSVFGTGTGQGTVVVTGAGSAWNMTGGSYGIIVGNHGVNGSLTIADGAEVHSSQGGILGVTAGSNGSAEVTGADSTWTNSSSLIVGYQASGNGNLTIEDGGLVQASQVFVGLREDSEGVLVVKNATLNAGIRLGIGYNFSLIGGKASARLVNGTVIANNIFIGANGKLIGTGTITGNVIVEGGGTLSPGLSPGQVTINGDLNITNGLMELEADSPSLKDGLVVSGNVNIGPEAVFNIVLGFGITEAFDIGDFFFDVSGNLTVDPGFQADHINIVFTADSGMTNGQTVEITLGGSQFSVPAAVLPPTYVEVQIDIKPGSNPSSVNLKSKGLTPVAIHTTSDFNAANVNPMSVLLGDCAVPVKAELYDCDEIPNTAYDPDLNPDVPETIGDGDTDLVLYFVTKDLECLGDVTEATLTGETYDGTNIQGTGDISFVKKDKP